MRLIKFSVFFFFFYILFVHIAAIEIGILLQRIVKHNYRNNVFCKCIYMIKFMFSQIQITNFLFFPKLKEEIDFKEILAFDLKIFLP